MANFLIKNNKEGQAWSLAGTYCKGGGLGFTAIRKNRQWLWKSDMPVQPLKNGTLSCSKWDAIAEGISCE